MADDITDERKKMEALRLTNQRLLDEKKLLLLKLQEGEKYKRDLKEAQKGAKKFAAQKEKLQTVLNKRSVDEGLAKEKYKAADAEHDVLEGKRNEKVNESGETLKFKTENQALRAKNETLILEKGRLEEQNSILIQEITNLKTNYERQRKCMELLESENQRLSQIISQQEVTIRAHTLAQEEKGALMKEQLKSYEEDFKKEKSEREKLQRENLARQEKLDNANITVEALQKQIRELLLQKNQAQAEPMYPRGPPSPSYVNALPYGDVERRYMRGFAEVDPTYYFHGDRLSSRARGNVLKMQLLKNCIAPTHHPQLSQSRPMWTVAAFTEPYPIKILCGDKEKMPVVLRFKTFIELCLLDDRYLDDAYLRTMTRMTDFVQQLFNCSFDELHLPGKGRSVRRLEGLRKGILDTLKSRMFSNMLHLCVMANMTGFAIEFIYPSISNYLIKR